MKKIILGVFDIYMDADTAYADFISKGFASSNVSIITREDTVKNLIDVNKNTANDVKDAVVTGGVVGGLVGLLAGMGALAIPGVGSLFIAGPITALLGLTGAAALTTSGALTGVLAGGVIGVLKELGVDEIKAKLIESRIKEGAVLLTVTCTDIEESLVTEVFKKNGATNITTIDIKE